MELMIKTNDPMHFNEINLTAIKAIIFGVPAFWFADSGTMFVIDLFLPTVAESIKIYVGTLMGSCISLVILFWWLNKWKISSIAVKKELLEQEKAELDLQPNRLLAIDQVKEFAKKHNIPEVEVEKLLKK